MFVNVRDKAILALLTEPTIEAAATVVGVNEKTLRRWLKDDADFQQRLEETRRDIFLHSVARSQAMQNDLLTKALALYDSAKSEMVKVSILRMLFDHNRATFEWRDISQRIDAIERARANEPQS
jgi:hypothetical protein